jgi:hypothetical protein
MNTGDAGSESELQREPEPREFRQAGTVRSLRGRFAVARGGNAKAWNSVHCRDPIAAPIPVNESGRGFESLAEGSH